MLNTTSTRKQITRGAILGYLSLALSILSGIVFTPWIIKSISNEGYGLYTMSTSLISLFLFDFGLSSTANVFLSKLKAKDDQDGINCFLGTIYKLFFIIDFILLLIFVVVFFCCDYIYVALDQEELKSFKIIFLITALFSLISFPTTTLNGVFLAYERFTFVKIVDILNKIFYVVFTSIAILLNLGLYALVMANFIAGILTILIKFIYYKKIGVKANFKFHVNKDYLKKILFFSFWAAINSLTSRLVFNIMPTLFAMVKSNYDVTLSSAVFGVASIIEGYVYMVGSVMNGFFLPHIERLKADPTKTQKDIDQFSIKVGKIHFFIISLIFIGFASCGKEFITFWMHGDPIYIDSYYGTLIMISTQILTIPMIVFYTQLSADSKKIKFLCLATLIKAIFNLSLSIPLIKFYGFYGAFYSIFASRLLEIIMQFFLFKKCLNANIFLFSKNVFIKSIPAFALTLIIGLTMHFTIPLSAVPNFFIIGFTVVVTFPTFSFLLTLDSCEKKEFIGYAKKILRKKTN